MIDLSLLKLYKVIILSRLTTMEEFIKKDNTEILKLLKHKDRSLNSEPIIIKDPRIETNKNNNKLHYISNNNAELITCNPTSVKKLIYIN